MSNDVNWVRDDAAVVVLSDIGLPVVDEVVNVNMIDLRKSRENRARKNPLDDTRLDGIKNAIRKGVPIPQIVLRRLNSGYVIAGGNHRFASINGARSVPAHVIECSDLEFETVCRLLNTVVGEGMTRDERIESAADAVMRLGLSQVEAATLYGVSPSTVGQAVSAEKAKARMASLPASVRKKVKSSHIRKLGDIANNDNVLRSAMLFIADTKASTADVAEVSKIAKTKTTEAEQVAVFEDAARLRANEKRRVYVRPIRKAFLASVGSLQQLRGKQAWSELQIETAEIEIVKKQVKDVITMLQRLCRADG